MESWEKDQSKCDFKTCGISNNESAALTVWQSKPWLYFRSNAILLKVQLVPTGTARDDWGTLCLCLCSLWVSSAVVFLARAGTKTERAPPLSQVALKVTGKVIDYTLCRADRAQRAAHSTPREMQKRQRAGRVGHSLPPLDPSLNLNLINFSWEVSRSKRQRECLDGKGVNPNMAT